MSSAKIRRAASPPESRPIALSASSPENSTRPSCVRTKVGLSPGQAASITSSGVAALVGQHLVVILGEVADAHLVSPDDAAGVGRQVVDQDLEQRRLAEPVRADDRDALAPPHAQRDVAEHALVAVGLGDAAHLQHVAAARPLGGDAQQRRAARARRQLLDLDARDLLEAARPPGWPWSPWRRSARRRRACARSPPRRARWRSPCGRAPPASRAPRPNSCRGRR